MPPTTRSGTRYHWPPEPPKFDKAPGLPEPSETEVPPKTRVGKKTSGKGKKKAVLPPTPATTGVRRHGKALPRVSDDKDEDDEVDEEDAPAAAAHSKGIDKSSKEWINQRRRARTKRIADARRSQK